MTTLRAIHAKLCVLLLLACCLAGCGGRKHDAPPPPVRDLQQIRDSGELVMLTLYSSTTYFIYRGQDMGFQYELGKQFADSLGLGLKVKTAKNVPELVHMLQSGQGDGVDLRVEVARSVPELCRKLLSGQGDLIAYNLPFNKDWTDSLTYCGAERITHQVVVQRPRGRTKALRDVTELVGKDVYVKPGKYYHRLLNLDQELSQRPKGAVF